MNINPVDDNYGDDDEIEFDDGNSKSTSSRSNRGRNIIISSSS